MRAQEACDGRPIRRISVVTRSLFTRDSTSIPGFLQGLGEALHWQTGEATVRRELLFAVGEPCDPLRLAETERLLRAQPYLRYATVTTREATGQYVDVVVVTYDDWTLRGSARIDTRAPTGPVRRLRLSEESVGGRGIRAQARYNHEGRQPGVDLTLGTRQLLGAQDAEVVAGTSGLGPVLEQWVLHAYESDFDRTAFREGTRYRKEPFFFTSPDWGLVVQPVVAAGVDVGVGRRFGHPGRLALIGATLSFERLYIEGPAFASSQPAYDSLAAAALSGRYSERRRARGHLLLGVRALRFVQYSGIDAVNAAEDIRLGFEGGLVGGRTLLHGRGLQRDRFGAAELYAGARLDRRTLVFLQGKWEGRWLESVGAWDGVIAWADVAAYHIDSRRSTTVLGVTASGGWSTSTPFQLDLAGPNGLRGFAGHGLAAARRIVAHAERRTYRGSLFDAIDLGTAVFADVGRGWAGQVPFGRTTGTLASVGAGLRAAFPRGSRLTYRLDLALPVAGGRGLELRTGFRQQFGILRGEAEDVVRSREQVSSVTVFNFPRF